MPSIEGDACVYRSFVSSVGKCGGGIGRRVGKCDDISSVWINTGWKADMLGANPDPHFVFVYVLFGRLQHWLAGVQHLERFIDKSAINSKWK